MVSGSPHSSFRYSKSELRNELLRKLRKGQRVKSRTGRFFKKFFVLKHNKLTRVWTVALKIFLSDWFLTWKGCIRPYLLSCYSIFNPNKILWAYQGPTGWPKLSISCRQLIMIKGQYLNWLQQNVTYTCHTQPDEDVGRKWSYKK